MYFHLTLPRFLRDAAVEIFNLSVNCSLHRASLEGKQVAEKLNRRSVATSMSRFVKLLRRREADNLLLNTNFLLRMIPLRRCLNFEEQKEKREKLFATVFHIVLFLTHPLMLANENLWTVILASGGYAGSFHLMLFINLNDPTGEIYEDRAYSFGNLYPGSRSVSFGFIQLNSPDYGRSVCIADPDESFRITTEKYACFIQ